MERRLDEAVKEKEAAEEERERLAILLEEERKRAEDLQFRYRTSQLFGAKKLGQGCRLGCWERESRCLKGLCHEISTI